MARAALVRALSCLALLAQGARVAGAGALDARAPRAGAVTSFGAPAGPCGARSQVQVLRVDASWLTPDAVFDAARGRLHVVYGTPRKDAYYVWSDGSGAFSPPTRLNTAGLGVTTTMGERGPKITLGAGGRVVVVWADEWTGAGCRVYARSSVSADGGATWSPPASVAPGLFGVDGLSVAAGAAGAPPPVVATFHVNVSSGPPPGATSATYLHYALSRDGGATWDAPAVLAIDGGATPAVACSMCMTRPRFDAGTGELLVAYRAAIGNVRDHRVVRGGGGGGGAFANNFTTAVVNPADAWRIEYCPMNGPELSLAAPPGAAGATQLVAFMTGDANNVFFSSRAAGDGAFAGHVATPAREPNERYPTAVASAQGDTLFVWNVGPMAVEGSATVKWACYAPGSAAAAQSGALGVAFAGTKATALDLGDRGGLLVITSAVAA